jgi:hypothetical protein
VLWGTAEMIDWQQLALNLRRSGSLTSYSLKIGRNKGFINQFALGIVKEPKFEDGIKLLDLHFDVVGGQKHKQLFTRNKNG